MLRSVGLALLPLSAVTWTFFAGPATAHSRVIDLYNVYWAAQTLDSEYNPDALPDMDGDGYCDLDGQPNITAALEILADADHPHHTALHSVFTANEDVARTALQARWPGQPIADQLAALWALYMTIQGPGTFQGPTHFGMVGRVENIWNYVDMASVAGPFDADDWVQSELFLGTVDYNPTISVTGGGIVMEGDRVVLAAGPVGALGYQWYKDSEPLDTGTSANFILDPVQLIDAGDYYCQLEVPDKSSLETPRVTLVVMKAPSISALSPICTSFLLFLLIVLALKRIRHARRVRSA